MESVLQCRRRMQRKPHEPDSVAGSVSGRKVSEGRYCNSFRVGYNRAEFMLEFGQAFEGQDESAMTTRVVTAPEYAKALGQLILQSVTEYEAKYGVIQQAPE